MVVKTIVVRNLFSFEYDGSNPSLPTIKINPWRSHGFIFMRGFGRKDSKRRIRKRSDGPFSRRGSPNPSLPTNKKITTKVVIFLLV